MVYWNSGKTVSFAAMYLVVLLSLWKFNIGGIGLKMQIVYSVLSAPALALPLWIYEK